MFTAMWYMTEMDIRSTIAKVTHSLTHLLTYSPTYLLTYSLTHSLTHSLTIAKVCVKVAHDHSVDEVARKSRVDAIGIVGELYVKCNGTVDAGLNDILNQMKQQQQHMQQQQQGNK